MNNLFKKERNFVILVLTLFFLITPEIFSLTAKPPQGKPCEPPCCEEIGEKRYYFCVSVTVVYEITCNALCPHPEGIGYEYYECQPRRILRGSCCNLLANAYYVENGCDNSNLLECFSDADQVDCYFDCQDEIENNRNCQVNKSEPRIIEWKYNEQPKPFLIRKA